MTQPNVELPPGNAITRRDATRWSAGASALALLAWRLGGDWTAAQDATAVSVDPGRLQQLIDLSQTLCGGGNFTNQRATVLYELIFTDPALETGFDQLLATPPTPGQPISPDSALATVQVILLFWYADLYAGSPLPDRGSAYYQMTSWQAMYTFSWSVNLIEQGVWGTDLYNQIAPLNVRAVRLSALCEQLSDPDSRVTVSDQMDAIGLPRPELHYIIDDYAKQSLQAARETFTAIFEALGTTQITHSDIVFGAGHVMGTYRMGSDATSSVTDSYGRTWDHPNLWLAGSGLFPTTGTGNPTLTIAALALRAAPEIEQALAESA